MTAIQKAREALETALNSIGDLIVVNGQVSWAAVARIQDEIIRDVAALAALDAETEVKVRGCATEGCGKPAIYHFIRGDVGSHYCRDCYMRVQALIPPESRS